MMINRDAIKWQIGDIVGRLDLDIILIVDNYEPDTGEYFVNVGIWDDETNSYDIIQTETGGGDERMIVAAVSEDGIEQFVRGVTPRAVDDLINQFAK